MNTTNASRITSDSDTPSWRARASAGVQMSSATRTDRKRSGIEAVHTDSLGPLPVLDDDECGQGDGAAYVAGQGVTQRESGLGASVAAGVGLDDVDQAHDVSLGSDASSQSPVYTDVDTTDWALCAHCEKRFEPVSRRQIYCDSRCRREVSRAKLKAKYHAENPEALVRSMTLPPEADLIGRKLRAMRKRAGLTQVEVARRMGLAHNRTVCRWELGRVEITYRNLIAFTEACGYSGSYRVEPRDGTVTVPRRPSRPWRSR